MRILSLYFLTLVVGVHSADCSESVWAISLEARSRIESEIATNAITTALKKNEKPFVVHKGLAIDIEVMKVSKDELEGLVRDALSALKREDIKSVRWWITKSNKMNIQANQ